MHTDIRIGLLIEILEDESSRLDEIDDAIIDLGQLRSLKPLNPILKIAINSKKDEMLLESAGEALAQIMIDLDEYDGRFVESLAPVAQREFIGLIKAKRPEWLNNKN